MSPKPTLTDAEQALKKYWGYDSFRPGQDEVIESVLEGKDTLVLFPTGGGKSLCYQVPAMVLDGLTIVISPLVALMQDQVEQLKKLGIRATFINSTIPGHEVEQRLVNARNGMYRMLYIAPERLATDRWKIEQEQLNISLVAIDEAHCISEWGHNFRPSYRKIREEFGDLNPDVRWIALTATATPEVREDILKNLEFGDPNVVTGGFDRPNLQWWVHKTEKKSETLKKAVQRGAKLGSGIVYANTRRDCEKWSGIFNQMGISSAAYHAGLSSERRELVQNEWIDSKTAVVVATNAFGMGIDKPDCRFVVHYTLPISLEAYYQEAGRAGRDGLKSYPILIYKDGDVDLLRSRIERSYPDVETLKTTYNSVCDELGLAVGSEQERPEPVSFSNIKRRSGLTENQIKASLEVLQRLEIVELTELYYAKIGVRFIVDNNYLQEFIEKSASRKGDMLDLMYRQFGPNSFHEMHHLKEEYICDKLNITPHQLKKALKVFSEDDQLLQWEYLGDMPLVRLLEARAQQLRIDHHEAYHYRDVLLKKLNYMNRYAETTGCREQFLRVYFGETSPKPCGHCDLCMKSEKNQQKGITQKDVERLLATLEHGDLSFEQICRKMNWNSQKTDEVIRRMLQEQYLNRISEDTVVYSLNKED